MFKNINELLTFLSIIIAFVIVMIYFITLIFSTNKESFSLSKMFLNYFDNEDE